MPSRIELTLTTANTPPPASPRVHTCRAGPSEPRALGRTSTTDPAGLIGRAAQTRPAPTARWRKIELVHETRQPVQRDALPQAVRNELTRTKILAQTLQGFRISCRSGPQSPRIARTCVQAHMRPTRAPTRSDLGRAQACLLHALCYPSRRRQSPHPQKPRTESPRHTSHRRGIARFTSLPPHCCKHCCTTLCERPHCCLRSFQLGIINAARAAPYAPFGGTSRDFSPASRNCQRSLPNITASVHPLKLLCDSLFSHSIAFFETSLLFSMATKLPFFIHYSSLSILDTVYMHATV